MKTYVDCLGLRSKDSPSFSKRVRGYRNFFFSAFLLKGLFAEVSSQTRPDGEEINKSTSILIAAILFDNGGRAGIKNQFLFIGFYSDVCVANMLFSVLGDFACTPDAELQSIHLLS
ncbi:hypothetical protein ACFQ3K_02040 [Brucella gallinifaecis]|uniref:Uncharacterized protein n=1 Tax=Brucella gallinifaecis TaxID=215590 RepID=A0A502BMP0_9HYPH|nr:hypothetical protein FHY56_07450 [Brucella gallinifaecis]